MDLTPRAGDMGMAIPITQGTCRYCGQVQTVQPCVTQVDADNLVTKQCTCEKGKKEGQAEKSMNDAREDIEDLFGEPAHERGEIYLPEEEREILFTLAELVNDELWNGVTVNIARGVKAKISLSGKGNLVIQRDDNRTRKREHK